MKRGDSIEVKWGKIIEYWGVLDKHEYWSKQSTIRMISPIEFGGKKFESVTGYIGGMDTFYETENVVGGQKSIRKIRGWNCNVKNGIQLGLKNSESLDVELYMPFENIHTITIKDPQNNYDTVMFRTKNII
jgi:hypothetical protein